MCLEDGEILAANLLTLGKGLPGGPGIGGNYTD